MTNPNDEFGFRHSSSIRHSGFVIRIFIPLRRISLTSTKLFVYHPPMPSPPRPTDSELAILRVLWKLGPSTVREVADALNLDRPVRDAAVGYTTALKLMQIMSEKGLVLRDETKRTHVYRPAQSEE